MATEKTIQDMLMFFIQLGHRAPGPVDEIVDSWMEAFSKYSDEQLMPAVHATVGEVERFPTPAQIIKRIKALPPPETLQDGVEMMAHCSKCGKWRWCRKEAPRHLQFECEDCYTGLTHEQRHQRYRDLAVKMGWAARPKKQQQEAA